MEPVKLLDCVEKNCTSASSSSSAHIDLSDALPTDLPSASLTDLPCLSAEFPCVSSTEEVEPFDERVCMVMVVCDGGWYKERRRKPEISRVQLDMLCPN